MIDLMALSLLCKSFNVSYFEITSNAPFCYSPKGVYYLTPSYVLNFVDSDGNSIKRIK